MLSKNIKNNSVKQYLIFNKINKYENLNYFDNKYYSNNTTGLKSDYYWDNYNDECINVIGNIIYRCKSKDMVNLFKNFCEKRNSELK